MDSEKYARITHFQQRKRLLNDLVIQVFDKNDLGDADKLTAAIREVLENDK